MTSRKSWGAWCFILAADNLKRRKILNTWYLICEVAGEQVDYLWALVFYLAADNLNKKEDSHQLVPYMWKGRLAGRLLAGALWDSDIAALYAAQFFYELCNAKTTNDLLWSWKIEVRVVEDRAFAVHLNALMWTIRRDRNQCLSTGGEPPNPVF